MKQKNTDKRRLTKKQFNAVKKSGACWRMSDEVFDRSFQVLVKGLTKSEVAKQYGVTRQVVGQACNKIYAKHLVLTSLQLPKGFVTEELCVPKKLMAEFKVKEKKAWEIAEKTKSPGRQKIS